MQFSINAANFNATDKLLFGFTISEIVNWKLGTGAMYEL